MPASSKSLSVLTLLSKVCSGRRTSGPTTAISSPLTATGTTSKRLGSRASAASPKARMLAPKKVYVCDTALSSLFEHGASLNLGHKLENVLFWHLKKQAKDLTYYHDDKERECDFVLEKNDGSFSLVQACYELTDDNRVRELNGLVAAAKRFGLRQGVIVTQQQSDLAIHDGCEVLIVPANEYLAGNKG